MQVRPHRLAPLSVVAPPVAAFPQTAISLGRPSPGARLALPIGIVAGAVRAIGVNLLRRTATYEVLVANETSAPIVTFAYASGGSNAGPLMNWSAISVPPLTSIAIEIDVPLTRRGRAARLIAELHAPEAHLTVDGDPPKAMIDRARRALGGAAVVLLALCTAAYAAGRPHVAALAAPDSVVAGRPFSIAYALAPNVAGEYTVETSDGRQLERGTLSASNGAINVVLPAGMPAGYDVRVVARNLLGSDTRVAHVRAVAAPAGAMAPPHHVVKIASLALRDDRVHGGDPIVIDYAASSTTGGLKLIDQDGTVRAEALTSARGNSILIAPHVAADQDFRVVMNVERGSSSAEAAVPVRILKDEPGSSTAREANLPNAAAPGVAGLAVPSTLAMLRSGPIAVADAIFHSNQAIPVAVLRHEKDLRVDLIGADGTELESVNVAGDQASLDLTAPSVTAPSKLTIVATYSHGVAQETVLAAVLVRPGRDESSPDRNQSR